MGLTKLELCIAGCWCPTCGKSRMICGNLCGKGMTNHGWHMWLQHGSDVLSCLDIEVHINLQWPSRNQGWLLDQISVLGSSLD